MSEPPAKGSPEMVEDKEDKKFKRIYVAVTSDRGNCIDVLNKRPDCIHVQ